MLLNEQSRLLIETIVSRIVSADAPLGDREASLANALLGSNRTASAYNERLCIGWRRSNREMHRDNNSDHSAADDHLNCPNVDPPNGTTDAHLNVRIVGGGIHDPQPNNTYH